MREIRRQGQKHRGDGRLERKSKNRRGKIGLESSFLTSLAPRKEEEEEEEEEEQEKETAEAQKGDEIGNEGHDLNPTGHACAHARARSYLVRARFARKGQFYDKSEKSGFFPACAIPG